MVPAGQVDPQVMQQVLQRLGSAGPQQGAQAATPQAAAQPAAPQQGAQFNPQFQELLMRYKVPVRQAFQEGGLATSVHTPQDYHERDIDFIDTRNRHMREMAGKSGYADGGGVWTRKEGQNPEGGLNDKGRASLRAQGHDIKPPVSAKQANKSPKAAARRSSFCARMGGMEGPMKDEHGKPTRKALALRKWDC